MLKSRYCLGQSVLGAGVGFALMLSACDPVPDSRRALTPSQKQADMFWLYSQFDANYAPLDFKTQSYRLDYEKLKLDYLTSALSTQTNEDFYQVMHQFVAQFRDPHTTATLSHGGLQNRATLAYIGISGRRKGDVFVVREIYPTFDTEESDFPIRVGDEISHIDGVPLLDLIRQKLVSYEDIGQDEANITFHMNRVFSRISTSMPLPTEADAVLTIAKRNYTDQERLEIEERSNQRLGRLAKKSVHMDVRVPWNFKDVFDFTRDQELALNTHREMKNFSPNLDFFKVPERTGQSPQFLALQGFDGRPIRPSQVLARLLPGNDRSQFLNTFSSFDRVESWTSAVPVDEAGTPLAEQVSPLDRLKAVRSIPRGARFITSPDATFPTYVTEEPLIDENGVDLGQTKRIATLFLNTFSPEAEQVDVVHEFRKTLEDLQFFGVNDLVIDLLNNGGGSLSLGMRLAQELSNRKVVMPEMEFILSDAWMREFEVKSLSAPTDSERTLAKRMLKQFQADLDRGQRLSSPVSTESLIPFALNPNDKIRQEFKTILLVNEMCASMCDIFTAILQDNHLAQVLGSQTMGAGGNVVPHYQAPNSHLMIRQTESLIIRSGGAQANRGYIENHGVIPDYPFPVTLDSDNRYRAVRKAAVRNLTTVESGKKKRKRQTKQLSLALGAALSSSISRQ